MSEKEKRYVVTETTLGFEIVPSLRGAGFTLEEARRCAKALSVGTYGSGKPVIDRPGDPS